MTEYGEKKRKHRKKLLKKQKKNSSPAESKSMEEKPQPQKLKKILKIKKSLREHPLEDKEMAEERKKKRKHNYNLEKELTEEGKKKKKLYYNLEKKRKKHSLPAEAESMEEKPAEAESMEEKPRLKKRKKIPTVKKSPRERRLEAKEMAEERKKKRKHNYNLEKELSLLWEKMRHTSIAKEERSKLISEALRKMAGKFVEIASSHVSARVLQTCIKYCFPAEKEVVFEEIRPQLLNLSQKKYSVHLVNKLLDTVNKKQLESFISSLHGHVAFLLRHGVASAVVEQAYQLGNESQKQALISELYSTELQLFKDLSRTNTGRLLDVISKLGLNKSSVLQHMTSAIQPILRKGILDYSIIHRTLIEYFTVADKISAVDMVQQLLPLIGQGSNKRNKSREPRAVRMIHSKDGLKVCNICVKYGDSKARELIIKSMKEHIKNLAFMHYGSLLLIHILSVVDDTKYVTKIIIRELQTILRDLVLDKNGRLPLLELLHPHCPRYLSPEDMACLDVYVPSLNMQDEVSGSSTYTNNDGHTSHSKPDSQDSAENDEDSEVLRRQNKIGVAEKKNNFSCRYELLVESGLAEKLFETCIENIGEIIRCKFGRDVVYELAVGGVDGILQSMGDRSHDLHSAIASLAACPKTDELKEEHVFENYYSSRTIRKLVLDSPTFACMLWNMALSGKAKIWAQGHSYKVVSAFAESSDNDLRALVDPELQPLIEGGCLNADTLRKHVADGV